MRGMKPHHRLTRAALMGVLVAAAVARADLGADSEASVLRSVMFPWAVPAAVVVGWLGAGSFDLPGLRGWAYSAVIVLLAAVCAVVAVLAAGADGALLLTGMVRQPLAYGSLIAALVLTRALVWRQGRR